MDGQAPPSDPARQCRQPEGNKSAACRRRSPIRGRLASSIFPSQAGSSRAFRRSFQERRPGLSGCTRSNGMAIASRPTSTTAQVTIRTRRGHDWTNRFPAIARALGALPIHSAVIDGEAVVWTTSRAVRTSALCRRHSAKMGRGLGGPGRPLRLRPPLPRRSRLCGRGSWRAGVMRWNPSWISPAALSCCQRKSRATDQQSSSTPAPRARGDRLEAARRALPLRPARRVAQNQCVQSDTFVVIGLREDRRSTRQRSLAEDKTARCARSEVLALALVLRARET